MPKKSLAVIWVICLARSPIKTGAGRAAYQHCWELSCTTVGTKAAVPPPGPSGAGLVGRAHYANSPCCLRRLCRCHAACEDRPEGMAPTCLVHRSASVYLNLFTYAWHQNFQSFIWTFIGCSNLGPAGWRLSTWKALLLRYICILMAGTLLQAEIPHIEEHVSKIEYVGVQTQNKLQDITAAAAVVGLPNLNTVHNSITTGAEPLPLG